MCSDKPVRVRFAPSPTGYLHVGNLRVALVNYLFAASQGGDFVLRIDDTDTERSKPEYEKAIDEDLCWIGIKPNARFRQSERFARYDAAAKTLRDKGLLYPCYETPEELERRRRVAMTSGRPPIYDRAALKMDDQAKHEFEAQGRQPHWRFKLSGNRQSWTDLVRGKQSVDTASVSDPVLIRADGRYLYTLPSVIDDIDEAITHVVRGEDHVTNSGVQIEIFQALNHESPRMAHMSLLIDEDGGPLSKRLGSLKIAQLRDSGFEPMALVSLLTQLGTSEAVSAVSDMSALIQSFAFSKLSRAPARFSTRELSGLNSVLLHQMPFMDVRSRLQKMPYGENADENFWSAVAPNLTYMEEAADWLARLFGPAQESLAEISESDRAYIAQAVEALPKGIMTSDTWREWTKILSDLTGRKGKTLFMPLRLALTGIGRGPELAPLLPLMGRARVLEHLQKAAKPD